MEILSIKLQLAAPIKMNRVELVKHIRALCGLSLKDAVDTVDSLLKGNGWNILHPLPSIVHQINLQNIFKIVDKEYAINPIDERLVRLELEKGLQYLIDRGAEGDTFAAIAACKLMLKNPHHIAACA